MLIISQVGHTTSPGLPNVWGASLESDKRLLCGHPPPPFSKYLKEEWSKTAEHQDYLVWVCVPLAITQFHSFAIKLPFNWARQLACPNYNTVWEFPDWDLTALTLSHTRSVTLAISLNGSSHKLNVGGCQTRRNHSPPPGRPESRVHIIRRCLSVWWLLDNSVWIFNEQSLLCTTEIYCQ